MSEQPDDPSLERLRAQDHEAFSELVRHYHGAVYRLALRLLRHSDDAQETAQETFLAAYEAVREFQGRSSVKTWLLSITYRKAVDRLQQRAGLRHVASSMLDESELARIARSVESLTDWGLNPEQHARYGQLTERLNAALATLPTESRAVFELRDLQGLSSREAADVLGLSEGAVRVRLHRVRQYLMGELHALFGEAGVRR